MKTLFNFISFFIAIIYLSSCASTAHIEKDKSINFNNFKSYDWVDTQLKDSAVQQLSAIAAQNIQSTINAEMVKEGLRLEKENPDLLLSYDVLVEKNLRLDRDPVYSRPFTRTYYNPYTKRLGTIYYPSQFLGYEESEVPVKEGTVTITMIDPKTDKTVWQGWATVELSSSKLTSQRPGAKYPFYLQKITVLISIRAANTYPTVLYYYAFLCKKHIMSRNITIIGGGNLGKAIAEGLLNSNFLDASQLSITRRNVQLLEPLRQSGIHVTDDNKEAVSRAEVIILAVKPFQVADILRDILGEIQGKLLISVVTGVSINDMQELLGKDLAIVRAMPNTAIAIRQSITCICSENTPRADLEFVDQLFTTVGKVVTIDEKLMEAATVLGACGIAYAMRFIRANIQGGIEIGFDAATASLIAAQTVKGAAELLIQTGHHPEQEIDKVTTPKGCTIAGLNEMEHQGFSSSLIRGVVTSYRKIAKDL